MRPSPKGLRQSAPPSLPRRPLKLLRRRPDAAQRIADRIAPPAPPAAPAAAAAPSVSSWAGTAGLGLALLGGNTQTITLTGSVALDRSGTCGRSAFARRARMGLRRTPTRAKAQDGGADGGPPRRCDGAWWPAAGGFVAAFALAGAEFDHVKNIESRLR